MVLTSSAADQNKFDSVAQITWRLDYDLFCLFIEHVDEAESSPPQFEPIADLVRGAAG
jgi:hypothetical protein